MSEAAAPLSHGHVPVAGLRLLGDDRLARRAAAGDQQAFAVLYQRHHQGLFRYCRAILGNAEDAADALQNTMAAALRAFPERTGDPAEAVAVPDRSQRVHLAAAPPAADTPASSRRRTSRPRGERMPPQGSGCASWSPTCRSFRTGNAPHS